MGASSASPATVGTPCGDSSDDDDDGEEDGECTAERGVEGADRGREDGDGPGRDRLVEALVAERARRTRDARDKAMAQERGALTTLVYVGAVCLWCSTLIHAPAHAPHPHPRSVLR